MGWLDLLVPGAAVLSLFLGVALLVQSIRHGRAIHRLEERLAESGDAATRASLDRIVQLQARARTSTGTVRPAGERRLRPFAVGGAVVAVVIVAAAGAWLFLGRDGGDATAQESTSTTATRTQAPADSTTVPANLTPLQNKSQYEVAVFNASGVEGAARGKVRPAVTAEGYAEGVTDDAPDGTSDLQQSIVMYANGNRRLGFQLAQDLDLPNQRAIPIEGLTEEQTGGADAVVMIGQDLANR